MTFASEARLPPDLIFGTPSTFFNGNSSPSRGPLTLLLKCFAIISHFFASTRKNLQSFHQREKDHYDLGAIERILTPGDLVRVRLKSRAKGLRKFQSDWSSLHEVISVKGVVVTLKELSANRKYVVHHDRLSNPLLSDKPLEPRALELNANPQENEQDSEEGTLPVRNLEEALMRTRSGRTVKSTRNKDFDYSFMLPSFNLSCPSGMSALGARLQSTSLTSKALEAHLLLMPSTSSFAFNQSHSIIRSFCTTSVPVPSRQEARIRREPRARVEQLGQQVFWVLDPSGVELMAFMYKQSGMLYIVDLDRQD